MILVSIPVAIMLTALTIFAVQPAKAVDLDTTAVDTVVAVESIPESKTMKDAFSNMPDALLPSLTRNNRLDLIDFITSDMKADVKNKFDEHVVLTRMTDNYLHLTLSQKSSVDLLLLPAATQQKDSTSHIICMVETFGTDTLGESRLTFYTARWQPLDLPSPAKALSAASFIAERPDTMTTDEYRSLKATAVASLMLLARVEPATQSIVLQPVAALTTNENKNRIKAILKSKTLKWDGKTFK